MSHTSQALSLEARSDEAFESQVREQARLRVRQARSQRARQNSRQNAHERAPLKSPSVLTNSLDAAIFGVCSPRDRARGRKWKQAAQAAALAAFGAGMLWPVAQAPEPSYQAPSATRLVRVVPGELLASLDAPSQHAR